MTNETLWKELANICRIYPLDPSVHHGNNDQAVTQQQIRAVSLLRQGYRENLDLICATRLLPNDPTRFAQLYMGDFHNRALVCFTSMENGLRSSLDLSPHRVETLPCRFVLSNMVNKSVIIGLLFDPGLEPGTGMLVIRDFYRMFNPTGDPDYPEPENFFDPGRQSDSARTQEAQGSSTRKPTPGDTLWSKKRKKKR